MIINPKHYNELRSELHRNNLLVLNQYPNLMIYVHIYVIIVYLLKYIKYNYYQNSFKMYKVYDFNCSKITLCLDFYILCII